MKKFKNFREFSSTFSTQEACYSYLCEVKWGNGFQCRKCGHQQCIKGRAWYYRRCQSCRYDESCTSNTLFHKLKFPVVSAFWICYQLSNHKKGISTMEISRQYGIHQETAWFFKRKVQQAMSSSFADENPLAIQIVDSEDQKSEQFWRLKDHSKFIDGQSKIGRAQEGNDSSFHEFSPTCLENHCHDLCESKKVVLKRMSSSVKLKFCDKKNVEIQENYWYLFNLKNWLRGIHHHVSLYHSSRYFDEFCYRFVNRNKLRMQHLSLIESMVKHVAQPYSTVKAK